MHSYGSLMRDPPPPRVRAQDPPPPGQRGGEERGGHPQLNFANSLLGCGTLWYMSTYWNILCKTCGEELEDGRGEWASYASETLAKIARDPASLVALHEAILGAGPDVEVGVEVCYRTVDVGWFARHQGHELVARNEYGSDYNQCAEWVVCSHGARLGKCVLNHGHDGECQEKP